VKSEDLKAAIDDLADQAWGFAFEVRRSGAYETAIRWLRVAGHLQDAYDLLDADPGDVPT